MRARSMLLFAFGTVGSAALGAVTLPLTAWIFAVDDIGRMNVLQSLTPLIINAVLLGLDQAYVREFHEVSNKRVLYATAMSPSLVLLACLSIPVFFIPGKVAEFLYGVDSPFMAWGTIAAVYLSLLTKQWTLSARMNERAISFSLSQLIPKVAHILGVLLVLAFVAKPGFPDLIAVVITSFMVGAIFICAMTVKDRPVWALLNIDFALLIRLLRFGVPTMFAAFTYIALTSMGTFSLRTLSGFHELGIYSLAISIGGVVGIVQNVFSIVWSPIIYRAQAEGRAQGVISNLMDSMLLLFGVALSMMGMFSWAIPLFLPSGYQAVTYLVIGAAFTPMIYMLREVTSVGISITRRMILSTISTVVSFLLGVLLNIWITPIAGAAGAMTASVLAMLLLFVSTTEISARIWFKIPRLKLYAVVGTAAFLSLFSLWDGYSGTKVYGWFWLSYFVCVIWSFRAVIISFFRRRKKR